MDSPKDNEPHTSSNVHRRSHGDNNGNDGYRNDGYHQDHVELDEQRDVVVGQHHHDDDHNKPPETNGNGETATNVGLNETFQYRKRKRNNITRILSDIWRYRKYIIIEPLFFFWVFPACFLYIAIQNLGLEKACRLNVGLPENICKIMLKKDDSGLDCSNYDPDEYQKNITEIIKFLNGIDFENFNETLLFETNSNTTIDENLFDTDNSTNYTDELRNIVCKAERDSQKAVTIISGIRGPLASIFPIIVILFAGGWSDKKNLRKPCMLFPMIGEALSATALLIASIYFEEIPMEFANIVEKVLPSVFGGQTLMIMGIYSYLTAITEEDNRAFRFGIFAIFATIIPIVGTPLAGVFYEKFGYVKIFIIADAFFIAGIIYLIFFVAEVKKKPDEISNIPPPTNDVTNVNNPQVSSGADNLAYDGGPTTNSSINGDQINDNGINQSPISTKSSPIRRRRSNFCTEFFDLSLAVACIRVFTKPRKNNGRMFLLILVVIYAIFLGPTIGELDYVYQFVLITLSLTPDQFSWYSTYSTVINTIGTFLMTGIFSKLLKVSDPLVGFISAIGTIISRPLFAFANTQIWLYIGVTADLFLSCKSIAIRTIVSSIVDTEELGRLYSVLGIADAITGFIFPPMYSVFYLATVDRFPGAFYLLGEIFFIPTAILFIVIYFYMRSRKARDARESANAKSEEPPNIENGTYKGVETTYM